MEVGNSKMSGFNDSASFLSGGGAPAAKFRKIGDTVTGVITSEPRLEQQRDFETGNPLVWSDGNPRMQLVVEVQTDEVDASIPDDDGRRRFFIKGAMKSAVAQAVKASGRKQLDVGGRLSISYSHDGEASRPGLNPPRQYKASYTAPAAGQAKFLGGGEASALDGMTPEALAALAELAAKK